MTQMANLWFFCKFSGSVYEETIEQFTDLIRDILISLKLTEEYYDEISCENEEFIMKDLFFINPSIKESELNNK